MEKLMNEVVDDEVFKSDDDFDIDNDNIDSLFDE